MSLSNEQQQIKDAIKSGKVQLISVGAPAGTGKSFLADNISNSETSVARAAPTGQAASLIAGVTINSLFGIPIYPTSPDFVGKPQQKQRWYDKSTRFFGKKKLEVLGCISLLIIDEKDMIRCDRVDWIDKTLRVALKKPLIPFGGLRIIFMGDEGQLPPVATTGEIKKLREYGYKGLLGFWNAKVWDEVQPERMGLTKVFRQEDQIEANILGRIRIGHQTDQDLDYINRGVSAVIPKGSTVLTPLRRIEAQMNTEALDFLGTQPFEFHANITGKYKKANPKTFPFPEVIKLKMGCRVIIKKNTKARIHDMKPATSIAVVNGDSGVFRGVDKFDRLLIELDRNHEIICLNRTKSEKIDYKAITITEEIPQEDGSVLTQEIPAIEEKVMGRYGQYPVKLAYASTIHSAQGSTLDRVHLMLSGKPFATGLTYVALSRVRTLKNLTLNRPLTHDDITVAKGLTSMVEGQGLLNI